MSLPYRGALITGGGSGVGLALAAELLRKGCPQVAICGRDRARLERAARSLGAGVLTVLCDVRREDHPHPRAALPA